MRRCYGVAVAAKRVVVGGAGISGLSLAFELERRGISALVIECERRAGGKIESERRNGFRCERGPAGLEAGERRWAGLYLHGNAYHSAGVLELVSRSGKLATRMAEELNSWNS